MTRSEDVAESQNKAASLHRAPRHLREVIDLFLSLSKLHPDLHPAVLAAILARPVTERCELLTMCGAASRQRQASDTDEVWEDAREELETDSGKAAGRLASDTCDDCEDERATRWSQLQLQREVHEQRLQELVRRRERLRWSQQYYEQTRAHHHRLEQERLERELQLQQQRRQARRLQHLQHLQRVDQLLQQLDEQQQQPPPGLLTPAPTPSPTPSFSPAPSPSPVREVAEDGEFTHVWDDIRHWEKIMDDDDKENAPPPSRAPQPDVVPAGGPGVSVRKEERKRWFEQALLSWRPQDDHCEPRYNWPDPKWTSVGCWGAWRGPQQVLPAF